MALGQRFAELTGLNITDIIHSVVEAVADRSAYSLGESQHAPRKSSDTQCVHQTLSDNNNNNIITHFPSTSSISLSSSPISPSSHHNFPSNTLMEKPAMGPPLADIDDTAAFMAAARSLKLQKGYGKPPAAFDDASSEKNSSPTPLETIDDVESQAETVYNGSIENPDVDAVKTNGDAQKSMTDFKVDEGAASAQSLTVDCRALTPESEKYQPEKVENREHLTTFASWGTPAVRGKPAAQVRRVIIKGLPSSWRTPDKVLSLVHGGMIESVSITPSGNAHVLFCDPVACKAFYDQYPNGIDLDKERKFTVFVDLGDDVDVISSQLSFNLSVGSTRVVRAVGVELGATMSEIVNIATANNRKVEKIIDSYVPGYPRSVSFRFCSIDDAVRFRAALVRNEEWEHCNVQYATDPCEVATGYHAD